MIHYRALATSGAVILSLCGTVTSQLANAPKGTVDAVPTQAREALASGSLATVDQQPSTSVLCFPPKKATTRIQIDILNESSPVKLTPYLDDSILPLIRATWYRLSSRSGEKAGGQATVEFAVLKDGTLADVKLVDGAGHALLGDLAIDAVKRSAPFPPPPSEFPGPSIRMRALFEYEPASNDRSGAPPSIQSPAYSHLCSADETAKGSIDCLTPPKAVYSPEPEFSSEARAKKTQGTVLLWVTVAPDGTVRNACAAQPLGDGLDEKAVAAVRAWKFEPAVMNRKAADALLAVEVDFHLYDKDESQNPGSAKSSLRVEPSNENAAAPAVRVQPSANDSIAPIGHGIVPPRIIFSPPPERPRGAEAPKYEGTATVQLVVTTEGKTENIKVLKSLGPGLDDTVIDAVRKWKFEPATKNGRPVATEIAVEVDFKSQ